MEGAASWLQSLDAAGVAKDIVDFERSAKKLSSDSSLAETYDRQWVAVHGDKVVAASADGLDALLEELDALGVPASNAVIRFIEREKRMLIL